MIKHPISTNKQLGANKQFFENKSRNPGDSSPSPRTYIPLHFVAVAVCPGAIAAVYIPEIVINTFETRFELCSKVVQPIE